MVMIENTAYLFFHSQIILSYLKIKYFENISCFKNLVKANVYVSYLIYFFLYFGFNKKFRKTFFNIIKPTKCESKKYNKQTTTTYQATLN